MTPIYVYWLGLFLIGPFSSMDACESARQWQMEWGTQQEVSEGCSAIIDAQTTYQVIQRPSTTYGAPMTPAEYARRVK
jgi:hypothetical protein